MYVHMYIADLARLRVHQHAGVDLLVLVPGGVEGAEHHVVQRLASGVNTPGLHNKIPAQKIFAKGWVAQEPICS